MKLIIKNGHVVDPANKIDGKRDVLVDNGKIINPNSKFEDLISKQYKNRINL